MITRSRARRLAALPILLVLASTGCSQSEVDSGDISDDACAPTNLKEGLAYYQPPLSSMVVAVVDKIGEPRLEGEGRSQTVYTPVTLQSVELLSGSGAPTEVFFRGGTADGHATSAGENLGLAPGGKVFMSIGTDPSALGGPAAPPPGPYVETTFPIDASDKVLVSGCWIADAVVGSTPVTADVEKLNVEGKTEKTRTTGRAVPLAAVRALVKQVTKRA